jgi:hypothetical protein
LSVAIVFARGRDAVDSRSDQSENYTISLGNHKQACFPLPVRLQRLDFVSPSVHVVYGFTNHQRERDCELVDYFVATLNMEQNADVVRIAAAVVQQLQQVRTAFIGFYDRE